VNVERLKFFKKKTIVSKFFFHEKRFEKNLEKRMDIEKNFEKRMNIEKNFEKRFEKNIESLNFSEFDFASEFLERINSEILTFLFQSKLLLFSSSNNASNCKL
jgi:hypothetical protein